MPRALASSWATAAATGQARCRNCKRKLAKGAIVAVEYVRPCPSVTRKSYYCQDCAPQRLTRNVGQYNRF